MRTYAVGDVHGQRAKLEDIHRLIADDRKRSKAPDAQDAPVVHLGDLTDRGPDSCGVIAFLLRGIAEGQPWLTIKGNHDRMFAGFMRDPTYHDPLLRKDLEWLHPRLGGTQTLASYGVADAAERAPEEVHAEARGKVDPTHIEFLNALPGYLHRDGVVFVHAGIRPGVPLDSQAEDDLLWIRGPFLDSTADHGALIVHGHTPVDEVTHYGNRVNVDTGAGFDKALSVIVIDDGICHQLTDEGRVALHHG